MWDHIPEKKRLTYLNTLILLSVGAMPGFSMLCFVINVPVLGFMMFVFSMIGLVGYFSYTFKKPEVHSSNPFFNFLILTHMGALPFSAIISYLNHNMLIGYFGFILFVVEAVLYRAYGLDYFEVQDVIEKQPKSV